MNIVFDDIIFSLQRAGGISVVWYELLSRMRDDGDLRPLYLDHGIGQNIFRQQLPIAEEKVIADIPCPAIMRYLPVKVPVNSPFLFHSSYYRYCTNPLAINITTVHDFTYEYFHSGVRKKVHSWQKSKAIRNSDYIICVSENTKKDLLSFFPGTDENRIRVIYNGVSDSYHPLSGQEGVSALPFQPQSYVLFVGDRAAYKNFQMCVQSVRQTQYNLVVVGKALTASERKQLNQELAPGRCSVMSYVSNEQLNILYNHAAALLYPSVYEGFGIPVLEAQKAGCPVIACNASSIPEVIATDSLLMGEASERCLIEKMELLSSKELVCHVREEGIRFAARFSWEKMVSQYMALYREAAQMKKMKW